MSLYKNKTIWHFKDGTKRYDMCYTKESMKHPAKMELNMCREIIKSYSKPGDLILDPMGGIGTTLIEGMLLNRNVIMVEYEQRFADMSTENLKLVETKWKFTKHGKGIIIKGDSRELSKILKESPDVAIFFPPFANENKGAGIAKDLDSQNKGGLARPLSNDPNNIDNIKKYGEVNTIITSPPFGDTVHGVPADFAKNHPTRSANNYGVYVEAEYSHDENNVGMMKGKNYLSEMLKIYVQCFLVLKGGGYMVLHTKNFVRAGEEVRLDLDTIKLAEAAGFEHLPSEDNQYPAKHRRYLTQVFFWIRNYWQKHPNAPKVQHEDILVFRKPGVGDSKVSLIATSPPFASVTMEKKKSENWSDPDFSEQKYFEDKNNIGNLRYNGLHYKALSNRCALEVCKWKDDLN